MEYCGSIVSVIWILDLAINSIYTTLIAGIFSLIIVIVNLFFNKQLNENRKTKLPIIFSIIFIIIESIILFTPIIMNTINVNNFNNAISKLKQEKNIETYVYKKDNNYIFLDNEGNKIAQKDYDKIQMLALKGQFLYNIRIDESDINLGLAKKDNKIIIINSQGEEMFTLCNMFDDYYSVATAFMNYMIQTNNYNITMSPLNENMGNTLYARNEKSLKKYIESDKAFEDNQSYTYMYFKNENIFDKTLQIVITNEKEEDIKLAKNYTTLSFNESINRDIEKIKKFYTNKKEYYLLDMKKGIKTKLECNNLIYEAYYNTNNQLNEDVLLYSNGYIPFYDTDESGYFDFDGKKTGINTSYLVKDINEKYQIVLSKQNGMTYFISLQNGKVEHKIENNLINNNCFYIKCSRTEDESYSLLDTNLNEIDTSMQEPQFYGNNILVISNETENIYYYDNEKIYLIDKAEEKDFMAINATSNNYTESEQSIYYKVGIIEYIIKEI